MVGHFHSDFLFSLSHIIPTWNNTWPKMREETTEKGKFLLNNKKWKSSPEQPLPPTLPVVSRAWWPSTCLPFPTSPLFVACWAPSDLQQLVTQFPPELEARTEPWPVAGETATPVPADYTPSRIQPMGPRKWQNTFPFKAKKDAEMLRFHEIQQRMRTKSALLIGLANGKSVKDIIPC